MIVTAAVSVSIALPSASLRVTDATYVPGSVSGAAPTGSQNPLGSASICSVRPLKVSVALAASPFGTALMMIVWPCGSTSDESLICGGTGVAVGSGVGVDVGSGVGVLDGVGVCDGVNVAVGVCVADVPPTTPHPVREAPRIAHAASVASNDMGRGTHAV